MSKTTDEIFADKKSLVPDHGFTHAGVFHADDVFSTAFLQKINPDIEIERGFKVPENYNGIVFDIGLGKYDHHQRDREERPDGTMYAAFGKLWRDLAPQLGLSDYAVQKMDRDFIAPLDASDNGQAPSQLAQSIGSFNPEWDSTTSPNDAFKEAVAEASKVFDRQLEHVLSTERARDIVMEAAKEMEEAGSRVLVLPQYAPWGDFVQAEVPDAAFVVFPSNRGGYNIQTVPTVENPMVGRVPFPQEWLGAPDHSLGMTFCHPGNFLASTETQEQAVNVANIALERWQARELDRQTEPAKSQPSARSEDERPSVEDALKKAMSRSHSKEPKQEHGEKPGKFTFNH